jgi:hypothetical protein
MRLLALLLLSACFSRADVMEIRLFSCSPDIADAMRKSLVETKMPDPDFEKAMERLMSSRQLVNIGAFKEDAWVVHTSRPEYTELETPGWKRNPGSDGRRPKNTRWEHKISVVGVKLDAGIEYALQRFSLPPGGMETGMNDFELESMHSFTSPAHTWRMIDVTTLGASRIVTLFRHTSPDGPPAANPSSYVVEGYFLHPVEGVASAEYLRKMEPAELRERIAKLQGAKVNYFQMRMGSASNFSNAALRHRKGPFDEDAAHYESKGAVPPEMTLFVWDRLTPAGPDSFEVEGMFRFWMIPKSGKWAEKHEGRFLKRIKMGEWTVATSDSSTAVGSGAAVVFRIDGQSAQ